MNTARLRKVIITTLLVIAGIILLLYLALRPKTIVWEEEVPLNTGETIWVKRTVVYEYKGASGNPFDMAFRPNWNEGLSFTWNERQYEYKGKANIFLLTILANKMPALIARASDKNWGNSNRYKCVKPYYVQLVPDASGRTWYWPSSIDPKLYGQTANIMLKKFDAKVMNGRTFSIKERDEADLLARIQSPSVARVEANFYSNEECVLFAN